MADAKLQIVINAVNKASKDLKDLKAQLGDLEKPTKESSAAMGKLGGAIAGMISVAAVVKLGKMVYDLGELGAQAQRVEASF